MSDLHVCEECGKRLASAGGLDIHMEMSHPPRHRRAPEALPAALPNMHPPMPAQTAAPKVRRDRRNDPGAGTTDLAEPMAWVLVVLLLLGGIAAVVHRPHPPSDVTAVATPAVATRPSPSGASTATTATTASTPGVAPANPSADAAMLSSTVFTTANLTGNWTLVGSEVAGESDLGAPDPCITDPVWSSVIAGHEEEFSFEPQPNGSESGHLNVVLSSSSSPSIAASRLALTAAPIYARCNNGAFDQALASSVPGIVIETTSAPTPPGSLPQPSTAYEYVVRFSVAGVEHMATVDDYHVAVGRVLAHIRFEHCECDPGAVAANEQPVLNLVVQRLQALPGA